ncbi:paired amphipathic helix protein Sin3a-like, partial [Sitodiplosis mosellana]|uniref:paired amphipathic helix protein Sin3a-like n=1 Tax=Sitodiplosis mosellana TaxID=263140 RepID=UPI0024441339
MKRRADEVQFGARTPQRMITTQHSSAVGPNIQYHIGSGVLKTNSSEGTIISGPSPTVQYTTTYPQSQTIPSVKTNVGTSNTGTTIHVVNSNIGPATNTIRHKGAQVQQVQQVQQQAQPVQQQQVTPPPNVQTNMVSTVPQQTSGQEKFQRLKVEDALSYLDQVKYKFGNQPQVYNDFLDIMKEFKSQSIDTPGVIQRVSNLFKGHPELIVGFNTFLPPGYKIEVQANDQGVAFQVSVSMPSPSGGNICLQQPTSPHRGNQIIHNMQTSTIHQISDRQPIYQLGPQQQPQTPQQQPQLQTQQQQQQQPPPPQLQPQQQQLQQQIQSQLQPQQQQQQQQQQQHQQQQLLQLQQPQSQTQTSTSISAQSNFGSISQQQTAVGTSISVVAGNTVTQVSSVSASANTNKQPISHNLHHISPPPQPIAADVNSGHNLHHISQAHQSMIQAEQTGSNQNQNQPVEFNHAISYVNKIKIRFQAQPEKYKRFLEILHAYQKEQKVLKEGSGNLPQKQLTEAEVYSQVAKLFDQQEDLLREFGQFLPDATNHSATQFINRGNHGHNEHKKMNTPSIGSHQQSVKSYNSSQNNLPRIDRDYHPSTEKDYRNSGVDKERNHVTHKFSGSAVKRSPSFPSMPVNHLVRDRDGPSPPKRHKPICRDVTLSEASKFGSLNDYAFFDKVRKALRSPEVYDNFLRCLTLFNQEIISRIELVLLITPFLSKFPELHRWFQDFLGSQSTTEGISLATAQRQDRNQGEMAQEIDLSTCKRLGASYCALPKTSESRKCSGRTNLCREVLNDTWVSFPTWAEDSTFVTSRKTQYEEIIYRCEDERFELDVVIETNAATIRVLEGVQKKISRMTQDELTKFKLDDCLGGSSPTIHQRALRRVYGDKATEIIQGLKKTPQIAVQVVLRRLKAKDEEWREAQKSFNKQWREQNEKYYLKSLDHQGINFKQNDIKALRSKSLFNDIETLYDERHEQNDDNSELVTGPHLVLPYKDKSILDDAANLLIHHVKRQTAVQKQEKTRIKHILRHFIPDLFFWPRQQLSDDERDDEMDVDSSENRNVAMTAKSDSQSNGSNNATTSRRPCVNDDKKDPIEGNYGKADNTGNEDTDQKSPSNLDDTIAASYQIPKSEFPFREAPSSAITDSNNRISDILPATEPNTSLTSEIKREGSCSSPDVPLPPYAVSKIQEEAYTLFFANTNWYLFLRLHAILCERLRNMYERAQILAAEEQSYRGNRRESTAVALRLKPLSEVLVEDYYPTFLDMLKSVLDGNMDSNHYEDSLREMFGIHAYTAFTLDRVVQNAVRQLQHCVTERSAIEVVEIFHQEQRKNGAGGYCKNANKRLSLEMGYQRRAETILQDENCFKVYIYKLDCRITIELLDTESDDNEKNAQNAKTWDNYVDRLTNPVSANTNDLTNQSSVPIARSASDETSLTIKEEKMDDDLIPSLPRRQLFLHRNIRMFKLRNSSRKSSSSESPNSPETLGSKNINDSVAKTVQTTSVSDVATINVDGV